MILFPWLTGCAEDAVVEHFEEETQESEAGENSQEHPRVPIQVEIDIDPLPTDIPGGNLYLAGFAASQASENMPEMGSTPIEFRQLGLWVSDWPWVGEVELVDGLRYIAIYALGEEPSPRDRMSDAQVLFSVRDPTLQLEIGAGRVPEFENGAGGAEGGIASPSGLTPAQGVVRIDIYPRPAPTDGGRFWLVGFRDLNSQGHPLEGAVPTDFHELGEGPNEYPMLRELALYEDLYYIAMYGHGDKPEPDYLKSGFHQFELQGGGGLELIIQGEDARRESEGSLGRAPGLRTHSATGEPSIPIRVRIDIRPPPERRQGEHVWLVGFASLNHQGQAPQDSNPADFLDLGEVPTRLPLERELPLFAGLHYAAMVGAGENPSPQDRRSSFHLLDQGRGHSLELTVTAAPGR